MKIEQNIFTDSQQVVTIEINEMRPGEVMLSFSDGENRNGSQKLFLTLNEAIELSTTLKSMVDKKKTNSL